jgi:hypothetical protein
VAEKQSAYSTHNHIAFMGDLTKKRCWKQGINGTNYVLGHNHYGMRYNNSNIGTHAEMECVKKMAFRLSRVRQRRITTDLLVIKVTKNGDLTNSRPCRHCAIEMSKQTRIKVRHLYYSNDNGDIEKYVFDDWYRENESTCKVSCGWNAQRYMRNRKQEKRKKK